MMRTNVAAIALGVAVLSASVQAELLVKVGDVEITQDDLKAEMYAMPAESRLRVLSNSRQVAAMVDGLISRQLFALEARHQGVDQDPAVQRRILIATEGLLVEALRQKVAGDIELPDFTPLAKERFERNASQYVAPAQVHARHILLHADSAEELEAVHKQVNELKARIEQGEDFAVLAREYSTDAGSVQNGGDLGFFTRGRMVAPFEVAAFALKEPGEMAVAETQFGVHLIQLIEREDERQRTFDEVEHILTNNMRAEYRSSYVAEWERELVSRHDATLNQDQIDELVRTVLEETRASQ